MTTSQVYQSKKFITTFIIDDSNNSAYFVLSVRYYAQSAILQFIFLVLFVNFVCMFACI